MSDNRNRSAEELEEDARYHRLRAILWGVLAGSLALVAFAQLMQAVS